MAWAPAADVEAWLARTPDGSAEAVARCRDALELVRRRGYAVTAGSDAQRMLGDRAFRLTDDPGRAELRDDVAELLAALAREDYPVVDLADDQLFDVGMVAAPVFGPEGSVIAAVSAYGFPMGLPAETVMAAGRTVRETAALATRRANGRPPT